MKKTESNPYHSILVMVLGFQFLAWFSESMYIAYAAYSLGLISLIDLRIASKIEKAWFLLSGLLNKIFPKIILGIFYFAILTPIALMSRVFGNKTMKQYNKSIPSFYREREKKFKPEDFENAF